MLPYILAAVGGYLIGDSLKGKQYAEGGMMMARGGKINSIKKDWDSWDEIYGRKDTLVKAGYPEKEANKLSKKNWDSLDKQVQEKVRDGIIAETIDSMKGMMKSLYTYGGLDKNSSYLEDYKTSLGKDVFNKTFNSYKKELEKFEVVRDVHTDAEGVSYNSLKRIK